MNVCIYMSIHIHMLRYINGYLYLDADVYIYIYLYIVMSRYGHQYVHSHIYAYIRVYLHKYILDITYIYFVYIKYTLNIFISVKAKKIQHIKNA